MPPLIAIMTTEQTDKCLSEERIMTDTQKPTEENSETFPPPEKGDSIELANLKGLLQKLNYAANLTDSAVLALNTLFSDKIPDANTKSIEKFIGAGTASIASAIEASEDLCEVITRMRREFPTILPATKLIFSDDPGSVCTDFITPLISEEFVIGAVIDGIFEHTTVYLPQIGGMDHLPGMVDGFRVYIEHDMQETSIPRIAINMHPNVTGAPKSIVTYATQVTNIEMSSNPTEIKVKEIQLYLDPFHLELIEQMLLNIKSNNVVTDGHSKSTDDTSDKKLEE